MMNILLSDIKKNILITGACGFIGSHLVESLVKSGHKVHAFDLEDIVYPKSGTTPFSKNICNKIEFYTGNIEEPGCLESAIKGAKHIFHLAARSFVPDSWKNPFDFYHTNLLGLANVLETCRQNNCSLTYLSSYVYGEPEYLPIDERHPLKSYNPYSHSKLIAEDICDLYKKNYDLKITIFRPFNVYGPGQNVSFLIPEIIKQAISKEKKIIEVNDLKPKRDYIYIDDLINALILSIDGKDNIYNIGSGYSVSVEDIIKLVLKKSGIKKEYISKEIIRENEIYDVIADVSKAKKELNWSAHTSLEEGIKNCIEYS